MSYTPETGRVAQGGENLRNLQVRKDKKRFATHEDDGNLSKGQLDAGYNGAHDIMTQQSHATKGATIDCGFSRF
jgi:hypothetical protein